MTLTRVRWIGPLLLCVVALATQPTLVSARDVPGRLSDKDFWQLVTSASEEGGRFSSENWVSNEMAFQTVLPTLSTRIGTGGVYVGVGPDQNFTYIAGLKPKLAFIVDIRRQNMLLHLMYKAVFELSPTRAEFLSRLFSRPRSTALTDDASSVSLMAAVGDAAPDETLYEKNLTQLMTHLKGRHKFALSASDTWTVEYVYRMFFEQGPGITYAPIVRPAMGVRMGMTFQSPYPSYADLMTTTDNEGAFRSYVASESLYRTLREMQLRNAIVPVVGDFAGPKALRAVGKYVADHGAKVTTFYTSNVEQYLFQNQVWREYYENVAAMPLDASSTFIRSWFPSQFSNPAFLPGQPFARRPPDIETTMGPKIPSATLICSIKDLLMAVRSGKIETYFDVIEFSRSGGL